MAALQCFQNKIPEELESYESDQQLSQMWQHCSIEESHKVWKGKDAVNNCSAFVSFISINLIKQLLSFNKGLPDKCSPLVLWKLGFAL